jgi:hypothetical protein
LSVFTKSCLVDLAVNDIAAEGLTHNRDVDTQELEFIPQGDMRSVTIDPEIELELTTPDAFSSKFLQMSDPELFMEIGNITYYGHKQTLTKIWSVVFSLQNQFNFNIINDLMENVEFQFDIKNHLTETITSNTDIEFSLLGVDTIEKIVNIVNTLLASSTGIIYGENVVTSAELVLGSGDNSEVTILIDIPGTDGNSYSTLVEQQTGVDQPTYVEQAGYIITVYLGTDTNGDPDDSKNTAVIIANLLNGLDGVTAYSSGNGSGIIPPIASQFFSGGTDIAGGYYFDATHKM